MDRVLFVVNIVVEVIDWQINMHMLKREQVNPGTPATSKQIYCLSIN